MDYKRFKTGLEELLLGAQQVLRHLETYQPEGEADRKDLAEGIFHAKHNLEDAQKLYEDDIAALNRTLMFSLSQVDKCLADALHAARFQVTWEVFTFYRHFRNTLYEEVLRALEDREK